MKKIYFPDYQKLQITNFHNHKTILIPIETKIIIWITYKLTQCRQFFQNQTNKMVVVIFKDQKNKIDKQKKEVLHQTEKFQSLLHNKNILKNIYLYLNLNRNL